MSDIDLQPLRNAISRLEEGVHRHLSVPDDDQLRDGLIQRFEFTYDLAHKMLRRILQARAPNPDEVAAMSFAELVRTADEQAMIAHGWPEWKRYRDKRNITSHTYDLEKARVVAAFVPEFLAEAKDLERRLSAYLRQ